MNTLPSYELISVDNLAPSPLNPRKTFDEASLNELADSIRAIGIMEPLIVREAGAEALEIIAGERRFRAAQMAGLTHVPCLVRDMTDAEVLEHALTENRQRRDVHPLEEADAIQQLLDLDSAYTPATVAKRLGMSVAWVYGRLHLLTLIDDAKAAYRAEAITAAHADLLTKLPADKQRYALDFECFNRLLFRGDDDAEIYGPDDAIAAGRWDLLAPALEGVGVLKKYVRRMATIDTTAPEVQEVFGDLAEAIDDADVEEAVKTEKVYQLSALNDQKLTSGEARALGVVTWGKWVEIITDDDDRPAHPYQTRERCEHQGLGEVIHPIDSPLAGKVQCCVKPSCQVHRPKAAATEDSSMASWRKQQDAERKQRQKEAEERQAKQEAFARALPAYRQALVKATKGVRLNAKLVGVILNQREPVIDPSIVRRDYGIGLTDATAVQVLLLAMVEPYDYGDAVHGSCADVAAAIGLTYTQFIEQAEAEVAKREAKAAKKARAKKTPAARPAKSLATRKAAKPTTTKKPVAKPKKGGR